MTIKKSVLVLVSFLILLVVFYLASSLGDRFGDSSQLLGVPRSRDLAASNEVGSSRSEMTRDQFELASSIKGGESNSLATSALVDFTNKSLKIAPVDIDRLLAFVSSPKPDELSETEWEERVNVILNLLRRQGDVVLSSEEAVPETGTIPRLTDVLLKMAEDNSNVALRIYAMQHLSQWYADERNPAKRQQIVDLLGKFASKPDDEAAGTALLMLMDIKRRIQNTNELELSGIGAVGFDSSGVDIPRIKLSMEDDITDWNQIDRLLESASQQLIIDPRASAGARISAIHSCVDDENVGALPGLRLIANDSLIVSSLRKAAIHAIGQLGMPEDMMLLESLPQSDGNLSQAVIPAKKALKVRFAMQ